ncbi:MAG: CobD/CbiB family cobalamin biosynthesis protein, partial [Pseudomonadota bacterium]
VVGLAVRFVTSHIVYGWIIEVLLLASLISQRRALFRIRRVRKALDHVSLEAARSELRDFSRRDTYTLDRHAVARTAIETAARHFSDRAVAPLFWYAIAGLPGLFIMVSISRLADRIAFDSDQYRAFGWTAGRVDRALKAIPARIAGLIIALAAFFSPKALPFRALKTFFTQSGRAMTPSEGCTVAATAGALDLALAGPRRYPQAVVKKPWIGTGTAQAKPVDITRAIWLLAIAATLNVLVVTGLALGRLALPF